MIGGVNGANVNLYSGFQNIREQSTSHIRPSTDENYLNLSSQKFATQTRANLTKMMRH